VIGKQDNPPSPLCNKENNASLHFLGKCSAVVNKKEVFCLSLLRVYWTQSGELEYSNKVCKSLRGFGNLFEVVGDLHWAHEEVSVLCSWAACPVRWRMMMKKDFLTVEQPIRHCCCYA